MNNLKIDWTKWINEDDSDLEEDYPFDKNEIMSGFENFKKELPEDVLEKLPDGTYRKKVITRSPIKTG